MSLYLHVDTIDEYRVFIHRRSRKCYDIDRDTLVKQIDIMPKASYATFDDDNSVGDIVIVVRQDIKVEKGQDFNQIKSQLFPINAKKMGISI